MGHRPDLWLSYQTTIFYWSEQALQLVRNSGIAPGSFVIITACNPRGEVLSDDENMQLHERLGKKLQEEALNCCEIVGASPDLSHQEWSFAVELTLEQGVSLGYAHQQNAIYHVENDDLWLVPVLMNKSRRKLLGLFSERLVSV